MSKVDIMTSIKLDLTKDETAMLIMCLDSALRIVEFTEGERKRTEEIRNQLAEHLEK